MFGCDQDWTVQQLVYYLVISRERDDDKEWVWRGELNNYRDRYYQLGASCQLNLNIFVVYLKQTNRCGRLYDVQWGAGRDGRS